MLTIQFINDGTGDVVTGNYNYIVKINGRLINQGQIKNHHRPDGWEELVAALAAKVSKKGSCLEF